MECEVKSGELYCYVARYRTKDERESGGSIKSAGTKGGNGGKINTEVKTGKKSIVC